MPSSHVCPDCGDPVLFAFSDTAGLGAQKQGDGYNTTPDSAHFVCFLCGKAWKQRLNGPLTPDVVGDIAFFTCKDLDCGRALTVTADAADGVGTTLTCASGHAHAVIATDEGGMAVVRVE